MLNLTKLWGIMTISKKEIIEICSDIISAIDENNFHDIESIIPITSYIGRFSRFLNALRTDSNKTRNVSEQYIFKLAMVFGINSAVYSDFCEFLEEQDIIKITESKRVKIIISDISDIYDLCYDMWMKKVSKDEDNIDFYIVSILNMLYRPMTQKEILKEFKSETDIISILKLLNRLKLIIYNKKLDIFYSPRFFGKDKEKVCDFIQKHKAVSKDFIDLIEEIERKQGYPLHSIPSNLKNEIITAAKVGILEPVRITVDTHDAFFLFTPDMTEDKLALSKETAAHFRYNEIYADFKHGRLYDIQAFLSKLIESGDAGSASNIATNYIPLEIKGVIATKPGGWKGYPYMIARKKDVLTDTKDLLLGKADDIKKPPRLRTLSDWIKNPVETRSLNDFYIKKIQKDRLDLYKIIRNEVR